MDQKEHIATLCALGTVGAAATGLAFATDQADSYILRPWKRKWPGASSQDPPAISVIPAIPRRSVTQPATPTLPSERSTLASHSTQSTRVSSAPRPPASSREDSVYDVSSSRGSSKSRRSILRARTASSRGTTEKRDSSSTSGWLKRLSSFSSRSVSPAPSVTQDKEDDDLPPMVSQRPSTSATSMPNKLVKRSLSQRGISHDEARGQILRRPATSHQRSQVFREILDRPVTAGLTDGSSSGGPSIVPSYLGLTAGRQQQWRPYFETSFPRKRRRSETAADSSQIRVLRMPSQLFPTMLLGSELEESQPSADIYDRPQPIPELGGTDVSNDPHRPRRSLNSVRRITRRRNYTDPSVSVSRAAAQGKFFAVKNTPDQSVATDALNFNVSLPPGSSQFPSSPPLSSHDRRNSFLPRVSISASDPPTTSSDADGRVFSDAESLDFQSDTAYDSVATRATNLSRSGLRDSKLDTIFAARTSDETEPQPELWKNLELEELQDDQEMRESPFRGHAVRSLGIGITLKDKRSSPSMRGKDKVMVTPPRSASLHTEDFNATPVPLRTVAQDQLQSSPPLFPVARSAKDYDQVGDMLEDMKLEGEGNDWSINDDPFEADDVPGDEPRHIMSSPGPASLDILARFQDADPSTIGDGGKTQQSSIFQWSENQHVRNFSRPKTVDGKQTKGGRSRSSGRKGPPQLHFRSQSVPVNREGSAEDLPSTSKYQTWRLGHKPVSEEWSDDFEFDDVEQVDIASPIAEVRKEYFGDSVRSVRIPQAIIDRQPSVHLQFGQVQEFMALVEEMKRLRLKGATLQILDGPARHLWEDAEGIINLATINDDDDEDENVVPPAASSPASSPASSDPFTEIPTIAADSATNAGPLLQARRPTTSGRRSVSTMTPPPVYGRARGESLAHARHFLQAMHQNRDGHDSSPREIEIHQQKRLPFDTQDLKDLVVRSGAITRALKDEVRRAEGLSNSPAKTPPAEPSRRDDQDHPLSEIFKVPQSQDTSPCPPFRAQHGLPKSRSANSYLESSGSRQHPGPFSSPITLAAMV